jgi:hypothetical protein
MEHSSVLVMRWWGGTIFGDFCSWWKMGKIRKMDKRDLTLNEK